MFCDLWLSLCPMSGFRLNVLLQSVRVFMLSRVTLGNMRSLPGVEGTDLPGDPTLATSNVYSVHEGVLLKWLSYHYNKVRGFSPNRWSESFSWGG